MSACLSDYSLASDSGVFEPPTKRLEAVLLPQPTSRGVTVKHKMYAYWGLCSIATACVSKARISWLLSTQVGWALGTG